MKDPASDDVAIIIPDPDNISQCGQYNETTNAFSTTEHIGYVYIMPIICLIGLLSNTVNLMVHTRLRHRRLATYTYFRAIAASDLITMIVILPIGAIRCNDCARDGVWEFARKAYEIYVYLPLANMSTTASVLLTVFMAIDRYVYVCKSLYYRSYKLNNRGIIITVLIASVLFNIPYTLKYRITACSTTELTTIGRGQFMEAYAWCKAITTKIIPIVVLSVVNFILIRSIRKHNERLIMSRISPAYQQYTTNKMKLTIILIGTAILFIVGNLPIVVVFPGIANVLNIQTGTETFRNLRLVGNLCEITSFATNFIFYLTLDRGYRKVINYALRRQTRRAKKHCRKRSLQVIWHKHAPQIVCV